MTREKSCTPATPYAPLKPAETAVTQATTTGHIREATRRQGAIIGDKALATAVARYLLTGKMTLERMKPDEAATAAALAEAGQTSEAQAIYRLILDAYPNHPLAQEKWEMRGNP